MVNIIDIFKAGSAASFEPNSVSGYDILRPGGSDFKKILDYSINNRSAGDNNSGRSIYGNNDIKSRIEEQRSADAGKKYESRRKTAAAEKEKESKITSEKRTDEKISGSDKRPESVNEEIKNKAEIMFVEGKNRDEEEISAGQVNSADKFFVNGELYSLPDNIKEKISSENGIFTDKSSEKISIELLLNLIREILEESAGRGFSEGNTFKDASRQTASGQIPEMNRVLMEKLAELRNLLDKQGTDSVAFSGRLRDTVQAESDIIRNIENTLRAIQNGEPATHEARESAIKNLAAGIDDLLKVLRESEKSSRIAEKNSDRSGGLNFGFLRNDSGAATLRADALRSPSAAPNLRENFGTLLDQARMVVKDGKNASFTMNLYPRELGMVRMSLGLENGVLSGRFIVESSEAKDALMANLSLMKDQLEKEGLDVGSFQVNIGAKEQQMKSKDENQILAADSAILTGEASAEYESMSALRHDGYIDLVV